MTISKTGFKRLWRLVEYMRSLPPSANKHFSMTNFYEHTGEGHQHKIPRKPKVADLHACGTTACALGWALTVPSFRRAGLRLKIERSFFDEEAMSYQVDGEGECFGVDLYDDEAQWDALFGADNNDQTPKAWARRVSKLLRQWEKTA